MSIPARCGCMRALRRARASKRPRCGSPRIEREIRDVIPPDEIDMLIDNIGIPNSWAGLAQGDIPTISSADGEILISLKQGEARPHPRLRSAAAEAPARAIPGHDLLLPAGQYHQPDSELRPAGAHRSAGGRARRRGQLQDRPEAGREDRAHSRRGRCARSPGGRPAGDPPERGSRQGVAIGFDAARRHQQHADLAQRQRHGGAEFLDELGQRRQLQRRRADASIPHRFAGRAAAHAHIGGDQRGQYHHAGFASRRVRGRECFRRRFAERRLAGLRKSRERCRAARNCFRIWSRVQRGYCAGDRQPLQRLAGFRRVRQRGPARSGRRRRGGGEDHARGRAPICRAAPRSPCAGRSRPCNRRSSAWDWAWSSPWFWYIS